MLTAEALPWRSTPERSIMRRTRLPHAVPATPRFAGAAGTTSAAPAPAWTTRGLPTGVSSGAASWNTMASGLDGTVLVAYNDKVTNLTCRQYGFDGKWCAAGVVAQ
jgi:hypothetical protein